MPRWLWTAVLLPRLTLLGLTVLDPSRCLRGDSQGYLALAANLNRWRTFTLGDMPQLLPETFRTPGYPVFLTPFLALFQNPILPIAAAQCLLGVLTAALAWRWYEGLGGRRGAMLATLVLSLDPVLLFHTPLIMTEALFLALMVPAAMLLWDGEGFPRPESAAACGILLALAIMVRPIGLYLPPVVCWVWRKDKRALAVFLLASYLLPAAWTARNWARTDHLVFSSIGGIDLLRYPAAGVESLRTGRPWGELDRELRENVDVANPLGYASDAHQGAEYAKTAVRILAARPFLLARYCAWGVVKVLGGTGMEMLFDWTTGNRPESVETDIRPHVSGLGILSLLRRCPWLLPLAALYLTALAALYTLALLGLSRLWRDNHRPQAALLAALLLYFLGLSSTQGYYRYRIPLLPFLGAAAAAAISRRTEKS